MVDPRGDRVRTQLRPRGWLIRAVIVYALSFALAELSWRLVESPFLRRKHRQYKNISGR